MWLNPNPKLWGTHLELKWTRKSLKYLLIKWTMDTIFANQTRPGLSYVTPLTLDRHLQVCAKVIVFKRKKNQIFLTTSPIECDVLHLLPNLIHLERLLLYLPCFWYFYGRLMVFGTFTLTIHPHQTLPDPGRLSGPYDLLGGWIPYCAATVTLC